MLPANLEPRAKLANDSYSSKITDMRRSNKPMMEKKRRARMNHGLNQLKTLILEAMKKDPARQSKMEKADIVELTVTYLQSLKHQNQSPAPQVNRFQTGFNECANEVSRYLASCKALDESVYRRLLNHLHGYLSNRAVPEEEPVPVVPQFGDVALVVPAPILNSSIAPSYSLTISPTFTTVLHSPTADVQEEPVNLSTSTGAQPMDLRRTPSLSSVCSSNSTQCEYDDKPLALTVGQGSSSPLSASSFSPPAYPEDDKEPWRPW